jgi:hypothetical protein
MGSDGTMSGAPMKREPKREAQSRPVAPPRPTQPPLSKLPPRSPQQARRERQDAKPTPPAKAKAAAAKLLESIKAKDDQRAQTVARERGSEPEAPPGKDEKGRFVEGHQYGKGRITGSTNEVPKSAKAVVRMLAEGTLSLNGEIAAHVFAERLLAGMKADPPHSKGYLELFAHYAIGLPKKQGEETTGGGGFQIVFMREPKDPLAQPGDPPKPNRLLGQVWGPNGEIIEYKTGKVVVPAPTPQPPPPPKDDGLGEGEDRLEIIEDTSSQCLECLGRGSRLVARERQRCQVCRGTGRLGLSPP